MASLAQLDRRRPFVKLGEQRSFNLLELFANPLLVFVGQHVSIILESSSGSSVFVAEPTDRYAAIILARQSAKLLIAQRFHAGQLLAFEELQ